VTPRVLAAFKLSVLSLQSDFGHSAISSSTSPHISHDLPPIIITYPQSIIITVAIINTHSDR
jgi:hypothetical protein